MTLTSYHFFFKPQACTQSSCWHAEQPYVALKSNYTLTHLYTVMYHQSVMFGAFLELFCVVIYIFVVSTFPRKLAFSTSSISVGDFSVGDFPGGFSTASEAF